MELKLGIVDIPSASPSCLNRTFYGIETLSWGVVDIAMHSLNRTFYGIETLFILLISFRILVLIVPFMELKPCNEEHPPAPGAS